MKQQHLYMLKISGILSLFTLYWGGVVADKLRRSHQKCSLLGVEGLVAERLRLSAVCLFEKVTPAPVVKLYRFCLVCFFCQLSKTENMFFVRS